MDEDTPERPVARQCTARSSQTGKRCRRSAILGGTVCATHGGRAPAVKEAARLRLANLVDPAISILAKEMTNAEASADRQRAANSILDRSGFGRAAAGDTDTARDLLLERLLELQGDK